MSGQKFFPFWGGLGERIKGVHIRAPAVHRICFSGTEARNSIWPQPEKGTYWCREDGTQMDGACMKLMAQPLSSLSTCAYLKLGLVTLPDSRSAPAGLHLWFGVKCLKKYRIDCHEIWSKHLRFRMSYHWFFILRSELNLSNTVTLMTFPSASAVIHHHVSIVTVSMLACWC